MGTLTFFTNCTTPPSQAFSFSAFQKSISMQRKTVPGGTFFYLFKNVIRRSESCHKFCEFKKRVPKLIGTKCLSGAHLCINKNFTLLLYPIPYNKLQSAVRKNDYLQMLPKTRKLWYVMIYFTMAIHIYILFQLPI